MRAMSASCRKPPGPAATGTARRRSRSVNAPATSTVTSSDWPASRPAGTLASERASNPATSAALRPSEAADSGSRMTRTSSSGAPNTSVCLVPGRLRRLSSRSRARRLSAPSEASDPSGQRNATTSVAAPVYWRSTSMLCTPSGKDGRTDETRSRISDQACSTRIGLRSSRMEMPIWETLARVVERTSSSSTSSSNAASMGRVTSASMRVASAPGRMMVIDPKRSVSDGSS